jgi:hypothetical protein
LIKCIYIYTFYPFFLIVNLIVPECAGKVILYILLKAEEAFSKVIFCHEPACPAYRTAGGRQEHKENKT